MSCHVYETCVKPHFNSKEFPEVYCLDYHDKEICLRNSQHSRFNKDSDKGCRLTLLRGAAFIYF